MINSIHARLHRPERGWDPVSQDHALTYGEIEWDQHADGRTALLDKLESLIGGFPGKSVLDLGGGPGHYTIGFAMRGADVTWHDVSGRYYEMTASKAKEYNVSSKVHLSLGYLDEAAALLNRQFDFVFNRLCWHYAIADRSFARIIYELVRSGGFGYIDAVNSDYQKETQGRGLRLRNFLNDRCSLKIGHPCPPRGRVADLLQRNPMKRIIIDYDRPANDCIFFEKA
jgi:SAM-dependent methyltransferase